MKLRSPLSEFDLSIKKKYRVLEVGGGDFPHHRSNVIVDKYADSNYHRGGDIRVYKHQEFINVSGENLPFEDKSFDYVICTQVLEHVEDPVKFLSEQTRVAHRGYLETPSIIGEFLIPKESHRWVIQDIDDKVVMYEKDKIDFKHGQDLGYVFQEFLLKRSLGFKIMRETYPELTLMKYEWADDIELLVNPDSSYYRDFFTKPWDESTCNKFLTQRSLGKEALDSFLGFVEICGSVFKSKVLKKKKHFKDIEPT